MTQISVNDLKKVVHKLDETFTQNKDWLCQLDSLVGDGDHGISVQAGFSAASQVVEEKEFADAGELMQAVAMALMERISGAIGPILSVMFLEGSEALQGKIHVSAPELYQFFAQGLRAVQIFGGAKLGDKTMVDSLAPAVEAMEHHQGLGLVPMLHAAVLAAESGVEKTRTLQAKRGRSRFVGERSIGHQDAGATSIWLLLKTISESVK